MKKIHQIILILLLSLCGVSACSASETHWLPILGTFTSPSSALKAVKILNTKKGKGKINLISSNDCKNIKPNLIIAIADTLTNKEIAQKKIDLWKKKGIKDAYIKRCDTNKNTRISLNIPLINSSFQNLDFEPINWEIKETLSSVRSIGENQLVIVKPYYVKDPEDVREGLRIQIILRSTNNMKNTILSKDCIDPEFFDNRDYIGFSCATEVVAMNLLHQVNIFSRKNGKKIKSINHCRSAKIVNQQLQCLKETIDNNGELQLIKMSISP
jgi:hypothetical protein